MVEFFIYKKIKKEEEKRPENEEEVGACWDGEQKQKKGHILQKQSWSGSNQPAGQTRSTGWLGGRLRNPSFQTLEFVHFSYTPAHPKTTQKMTPTWQKKKKRGRKKGFKQKGRKGKKQNERKDSHP